MKYKFKTKPFRHQMDILINSWNKENYAIFADMGTGKSKVIIDNIAILHDKGKINGALIVAPKSIIGNWAKGLATNAANNSPRPAAGIILRSRL